MTDLVQKTIGGINCLERPGGAPVLVFLHGIGSNADSWEPVMSRLPHRVRAIAWNAPGYRGSNSLTKNWPEASDYAEALGRLLANERIESAIVVGHSLGTLIAAEFAARYPRKVSRLILASCALGYGITPGERMPAGVADRIEELELHGPEKFAASRAQRLVFEPRLNPQVTMHVTQAMSQVDRAGYAQAVRMLASGDLAQSLGKVSVDTRFIIGINDRVTPEQQTLTAAMAWSKANNSRLDIHRIDAAGHAVYQQKPDEFTAALLELSGLETGGAPKDGAVLTEGENQ